jgi:cytochrome b
MAHPALEEGALIQVWDPFVRVFHWGTAAGFAAAYLVEEPRAVHEALGYVVLALLAARVVWGFTGSTHARFADFVTGPRAFVSYLGASLRGRERRYLGHNPAGGMMVLALMAMLAVTGLSGWMMTLDAFFAEDWVEELHEVAANATLVLVAVHVAGVVWESLRHRENLVAAMITGLKRR